VDKYGPLERYDIVTHLPRIGLPLLVTLGGEEGATPDSPDAASMWGWAEELAAVAGRQPNLTFKLIDGADHFYTGRVTALWSAASGWLEQAAAVASPS
jgi:hypothetical protein